MESRHLSAALAAPLRMLSAVTATAARSAACTSTHDIFSTRLGTCLLDRVKQQEAIMMTYLYFMGCLPLGMLLQLHHLAICRVNDSCAWLDRRK